MKIAILSDIHANIFAFRSVLNDIQKYDIEKILISGDLIGYYYWPDEVIKICMDEGLFTCIKGNHEVILEKCLDNKIQMHNYSKKYGSGYKSCKEKLSIDQLDWLFNLPKNLKLNINGEGIFLGHGSLKSTDEYIYPDASIEKILRNYSTEKYTIFGHTHHPFIHSHNNKFLINPGSVGQPRDTGSLASYSIINLKNSVVSIKKVKFDYATIVDFAMKVDKENIYLRDIFKR